MKRTKKRTGTVNFGPLGPEMKVHQTNLVTLTILTSFPTAITYYFQSKQDDILIMQKPA